MNAVPPSWKNAVMLVAVTHVPLPTIFIVMNPRWPWLDVSGVSFCSREYLMKNAPGLDGSSPGGPSRRFQPHESPMRRASHAQYGAGEHRGFRRPLRGHEHC